MRRSAAAVRMTALIGALALAASACGGGGGGSSASSNGPLKGANLSVGSKEFTEQLVLGQIAVQALEHAGANVTDKTNITGTANTRKALLSGQVDMYWEYTGTGWTDNLGHEVSTAPTDPQALFDAVAKEDLQKNKVKWFALSPANDSYGIATVSGSPTKTLTQYAALANKTPSDASLCAASEFLDRADGWPGVEKKYGFQLPSNYITEVDANIVYTQIPKQDKCKFGEVFTTDGRIQSQNLQVVEDDKNFFVKYNVAMTMRADVYDKYPAVSQVLTPIAQKLDNTELTKLNAEVAVQGLPPDAVAKKWLQDNGFV